MALSRYAARLVTPADKPCQPLPIHRLKNASSDLTDVSLTIQQEPEDASLTGGTRSLSRRLLALNIPVNAVRAAAANRKATAGRSIRRNSEMPLPAS